MRWSVATAVLHLIRYLTLVVFAERVVPLWWEVATESFVWVFGVCNCLLAVVTVVAMTAWLVECRRLTYGPRGSGPRSDPRPGASLWAGCLLPGVNLVLPPVFLHELAADAAEVAPGARARINRWWLVWLLDAAMVTAASWRAAADGPQAAADAVLLTALACLVAAWAAVESRAVMRCFDDTCPRFTRRFIVRGMVGGVVP